MKKVLILCCFILSGVTYASKNLDRGSAAVDEKYVEEIKNKESAQKDLEKGDKSNLTSEEKEAIQRQSEREGKPALEESTGPAWGNEEGQ